MVNLKIVEDRPTPKSVYNWRVYFSASVAAFAAVMIGYVSESYYVFISSMYCAWSGRMLTHLGSGCASPNFAQLCFRSLWDLIQSAFIGTTISLPSFKEEFGLENESAVKLATVSANIVSVYQAGSFFGAFAGYPVGYFLGRKLGLVLAGVVFCIGALIQCLASHKTGLGIMYAGRVIVGFCIGIASNLAVILVRLGFRTSLADINTVYSRFTSARYRLQQFVAV